MSAAGSFPMAQRVLPQSPTTHFCFPSALIVVVLYAPRVMLLHTVTHAGGQWSSPHTEHIMAPSLEAVHDVVMLGPRQAVMLCSVAQAQGTSLKAQLVMWNPDGSLYVPVLVMMIVVVAVFRARARVPSSLLSPDGVHAEVSEVRFGCPPSAALPPPAAQCR